MMINQASDGSQSYLSNWLIQDMEKIASGAHISNSTTLFIVNPVLKLFWNYWKNISSSISSRKQNFPFCYLQKVPPFSYYLNSSHDLCVLCVGESMFANWDIVVLEWVKRNSASLRDENTNTQSWWSWTPDECWRASDKTIYKDNSSNFVSNPQRFEKHKFSSLKR